MKEVIGRLEDALSSKDKEIEQLRDRLDKYESASNGANDGLWDLDFVKSEVFVSGPGKTMLGIGLEEEVDLRDLWGKLLHPEDRQRTLSYLNRFIKGKTSSYKQIFRLKHGDGTYRWILAKARAIRDENKRAIRISGSHTDITKRKRVADALQRGKEKYRNLFQNSLVAMLRSHSETNEIIEANDKFWHWLKLDELSRENVKLDSFLPEKERDYISELLEEKGMIENLEVQVKTADGEISWVSLCAILYRDEKQIDYVIKDISQTKTNLLELQKVNFELDSFIYHASHDLRSPLRSILGLIDVYHLEESAKLKDECINKIAGSVYSLDELVVKLLSISRNDRVNDPYVPINMMVEINKSISSYFNASNTTGLEIITRVLQPVPFQSDLTRVRIILNNLISNAIKYRSYHKERSYINIEVLIDEKMATIKVEDNGEGIEESKLPHIFDMFYRATEKSEGSGLGLYIIKKVAAKLNAEIQITSEELEGTTFTVTIPNSNVNP